MVTPQNSTVKLETGESMLWCMLMFIVSCYQLLCQQLPRSLRQQGHRGGCQEDD